MHSHISTDPFYSEKLHKLSFATNTVLEDDMMVQIAKEGAFIITHLRYYLLYSYDYRIIFILLCDKTKYTFPAEFPQN